MFQIFTVACVFIWTILCWRGWGPLQNNLMVFTWIIGLTGYKKGGKLVTSACSWSQKICTVTSFQKFALKTGLYKSNCQCKVCNKNYNVSCFLTFNYLAKRQSENRYTIDVLYIQGLTEIIKDIRAMISISLMFNVMLKIFF